VPWFALRSVYLARRADYHERNGGFVVQGYREWLGRHALQPVAHVVHPFADSVPVHSTHAKPSAVDALRVVSNDQSARLAG
jgi:hypothetical protein